LQNRLLVNSYLSHNDYMCRSDMVQMCNSVYSKLFMSSTLHHFRYTQREYSYRCLYVCVKLFSRQNSARNSI